MLGGAVGAGLFQKIKDGYSAISAQSRPGDRVFIFGFSRGPYTARSLAGMIAICGLPTVNQQDSACLDMAFEAYRNAAQRDLLLDTLNTSYKMDNARIRLLGVWDTVGSLGIPALFGLKSTSFSTGFFRRRCMKTWSPRCRRSPSMSSGCSFNQPSLRPRYTRTRRWCRSGFPGVH